MPLCGYFNPRPNGGALDQLQLKAALFRSGTSVAGIISAELCILDKKTVDGFVAALKKAGFDFAERLLICTTHTHTGPYTGCCFENHTDPDFMRDLTEKMISAVRRAFADLAPAELLSTETECSAFAFNRRYRMKSGGVLTNPGKCNPDIEGPEGKTDPLIPILAVKRGGKYIALIVNISNHTDTVGGNLVSADWPGRMEREIRENLAEYDIPVLTLIAPQGNINHFDVSIEAGQTCYAEAVRIGKGYAAAVLAALYRLSPVEVDRITFASCEMEAPYITVSDAEYAEAAQIVETYKDAVMDKDRDLTSEDIARKNPFVMKMFAQNLLDCRDKAIREKRFERLVAIGLGRKAGIVSMPGEPFCEIGRAIRENSDFPLTMVVALGLGSIGYVGLPDNYRHVHAYETAPSPKKPGRGVGTVLIETGSDLLKKIF